MIKENKNKKVITINYKDSILVEFTPKKFSDSKKIVKEILNGNAVIMNLTKITSIESVRLVDLITGALVAIGGKFEKVSAEKTYLLAPSSDLLDKFKENIE